MHTTCNIFWLNLTLTRHNVKHDLSSSTWTLLPRLRSRNVNAYHISNLIPYSISQINVTNVLPEFTKLERIGPILNPTYFTISSTATNSQLLQVSDSERNSLAKEVWQLQKTACKPTNQYPTCLRYTCF